MANVQGGIRAAARALGSTPEHAAAAVEAIMTSDTRPKEIAVEFKVAGRPVIHWAVADAVRVPGVPIVIATDSPELNDFALEGVPPSERGRVVCLLRPPHLSDPKCSGWEPFFWAMAESER